MRSINSYTYSKNEKGVEIELTPLIDIVFILLIFFIVTSVFIRETGVKIDKPSAISAENVKNKSLMIAITAEGQIFSGGSKYTLNNLWSYVAFYLQNHDVPVLIMADKDSQSGLLVDVIDECKLAGAKSINLSADQQ